MREEELPARRSLRLPELVEEKGGLEGVDGWDASDYGDAWEFMDEALRSDTPLHGSFDSVQDAMEFVTGSGDYSDRNSFFFSQEDERRQGQEGFFSPLHCHRCLEELAEAELEQARGIDPRLDTYYVEETEESHRVDSDGKKVHRLFRVCSEHVGVRYRWSETEYV